MTRLGPNEVGDWMYSRRAFYVLLLLVSLATGPMVLLTRPCIAFEAASAGIELGCFLCGAEVDIVGDAFLLCGDMSSATVQEVVRLACSHALAFTDMRLCSS